ncbi:MAG: amino acid ABC transporter ATP-binding protein, partial [Methyloversatilis sp.]|nr:amino acid ABC transporter ATP-binding protein [Methyloversatilis sp.]
MTGFVSIRNLRKSYGSFEALRGIDLDVAKGEVVCIIGPSGSGKSTLIRCINRLEGFDPASEIRVDGTPVTTGRALARVRAEVGMVFQSFNLFPHLTVRENVMLAPRRVRRTTRADAAAQADRLLARVGISS